VQWQGLLTRVGTVARPALAAVHRFIPEPEGHADVNSTLINLPSGDEPLRELLEVLQALRQRILAQTGIELQDLPLDGVLPENLHSIRNLTHYVVMRREDLRGLQSRLAGAGLSSLGRGEPHVLANIERVTGLLERALMPLPGVTRFTGDPGDGLLRRRAHTLFGQPPAARAEYIMVTMPTEAADDFALVDGLIAAGMDTARINCAHDDADLWRGMVCNLRRAARQRRRSCRILMDLGGHKIRTRDVQDAVQPGRNKPPRVHLGDRLLLRAEPAAGPGPVPPYGEPFKVAFACSCPGIVSRLHPGETVWIDDGRIGARVVEPGAGGALLEVDRIAPKGVRIKEEKGLNFPETRLDLPPLSGRDLQDLDFASRHADLVGLSFVSRAEDVLLLHEELRCRHAGRLPIVAKIETAVGVRRLPEIIRAALARNLALGVLIARGDLAVELGSVRMAEIQEEILWLCEAAHVPVIWATQVLESLAKRGVASRPEITDAAMSVRAECVMLNKGPYVRDAVTILSDVLQRMEAHQCKKQSLLRALHW